MKIGALRVDEPLSAFPPIEHCAALINIVDRRHRFGLKMLRRVLGRAHLKSALSMRGRWLIAIAGKAGAVVFAADSEDALLQAHREVIDLSTSAPGHLEIFHFVDLELRARIIADSKTHALRVAPCEGRA